MLSKTMKEKLFLLREMKIGRFTLAGVHKKDIFLRWVTCIDGDVFMHERKEHCICAASAIRECNALTTWDKCINFSEFILSHL